MRAALLLLWLVAACGREPSFDERYVETQANIAAQATAMDAEMARAEREAAGRREARETGSGS